MNPEDHTEDGQLVEDAPAPEDKSEEEHPAPDADQVEGETTTAEAALAPGELLEFAREDAIDFLEGLLEAMGLEGVASAEIENDGIFATVEGEDLGILIGRHGATLAALQELLRSAVQHQARDRVLVTVDIEGYRERRIEAVRLDAEVMAQRALEQGKEIELEPMPAFERKTVHEVVSGIEGVSSFSEGEEPYRRVVVRPEAGEID